jgi:hypothetical protein
MSCESCTTARTTEGLVVGLAASFLIHLILFVAVFACAEKQKPAYEIQVIDLGTMILHSSKKLSGPVRSKEF